MTMNTNWGEVLDVMLRSIISLVSLFLVTKALGKKQVSQLSLFDYVIGISIGNFAAEATINTESQYMNGITAVIVFGLVAYIIDYITVKSIRMRRFFMGVPTILIQDGKLIKKNLKKLKFDLNDLLEECRCNNYYDISQIKYAVMEASGKISILPKEEYKTVTLKDMNLKPSKEGLCANVIIDGKIMYNNLKKIHKTKDWLIKELKIRGKNIEDVFLATIDINEKLHIYDENKNIDDLNVLE